MARMFMVVFVLAGLALPALQAWAQQAASDEIVSDFNELFGDRLKKVRASYTQSDDEELVADMLESLSALKDRPALQAHICREAYELGIRSLRGCRTAYAAMRKLSQLDPNSREECSEKILDLFRKRRTLARGEERDIAAEDLLDALAYRAAIEGRSGDWDGAVQTLSEAVRTASAARSDRKDELLEQLKYARLARMTDRKIQQHIESLEDDPKDTESRLAIVNLLVVEMDRPDLAIPYLDASLGESWRTQVPLALKTPDKLDRPLQVQMARWYASLAEDASLMGKAAVLKRSREYYRLYLDGDPNGQGVDYVKAQMERGKVETSLSKLDAPARLAAVDALPTLTPLPSTSVSPEIFAWAKKRDRLPGKKRVAAAVEKLSEYNNGQKVNVRVLFDRQRRFLGLDLSDNPSLTSVQPLVGLPIRHLHLRGCSSLENLGGLGGMPLQVLTLRGCSSLSGALHALKGSKLQRLDLVGCSSLASLDGIDDMPITQLNAQGCSKLRDISALKDMKLTYLNLQGSQIRSLKPLEGMPLEHLNIRLCKSLRGDLSALGDSKLQELYLAGCEGVTSLEGIEGLPLKRLDIANCTGIAGDLSSLKGMKLQSLSATGSRIKSAKGLDASAIQMLRLDGTSIESLDGLEGYTGEDLYLRNCTELKDLSGIGNLATLRRLNLAGCGKLEDISPLKGLKINSLDLGACTAVKSLEPLKGLPLQHLSLHGCRQIEDLSALKDLPLKGLNLWACRNIKDLTVLKSLPLVSVTLPRWQLGKEEIAALKQIKTLRRIRGISRPMRNRILGTKEKETETPSGDG